MVFPHKEFEKTSCKDANIDKGYLADMFDYIEKEKLNIHSMLLIKDGAKIFDAYAYSFVPNQREDIYSVSKSFTSIAIGICQDQGLLKVSDKVLPYFEKDITSSAPGYESLTIKHLLTMSVGQAEDVSSQFVENANPYQIFFNAPLLNEPGTTFLYNNAASFILSAIVSKVTKSSLNDFLDKYLYQKLEINKPLWKSIGNVSLGATGLELATIDLAKFGLLLLDNGVWRNEVIVSKAYIEEATKSHISTIQNETERDRYGYGYQFWMNDFGDYRAAGWKSQFIIVNKRFNTVFAIQAWEDRNLAVLFSDYILPALEKGWLFDSVSLRDYIRRFHVSSESLVEEEKKTRK
ncbi:MAG: serine hydrolase domain-containing protein [Candidatus Izemoplasmatales bacterium]